MLNSCKYNKSVLSAPDQSLTNLDVLLKQEAGGRWLVDRRYLRTARIHSDSAPLPINVQNDLESFGHHACALFRISSMVTCV